MTIAKFTPQAWMNDYAIEVDPEGPTEWVVSPECETRLRKPNGQLPGSDTYDSDEARHDDAAPEWVREWRGPFSIELTDDERGDGDRRTD